MFFLFILLNYCIGRVTFTWAMVVCDDYLVYILQIFNFYGSNNGIWNVFFDKFNCNSFTFVNVMHLNTSFKEVPFISWNRFKLHNYKDIIYRNLFLIFAVPLWGENWGSKNLVYFLGEKKIVYTSSYFWMFVLKKCFLDVCMYAPRLCTFMYICNNGKNNVCQSQFFKM